MAEYGQSEGFPKLPEHHPSSVKDLLPVERPSDVSVFFTDIETINLQERAARLLQRSESSLNSSAAVSSEGLGSSPSSYTTSKEGESVQKSLIPSLLDPSLGTVSPVQWLRPVSMPSPAIHVLPSSGCQPEEDILFQWRLRRKMEQARDGALLVSTRKKSLSPPVKLPKQVISERLFSPPPSPKSVGNKSMRGSRIKKEKSKAAQAATVEPDTQKSLEMAAMLLQQAEESDGSEFQDDPLLQILRQQRDKLRDRLREVAIQIECQSTETAS
ncbi:proline and serine-rich protein 3 [Microcaecilia unicolor]|uniref:Proline and serine-rich protein 3 n=1 Tax=Microcaecilia unicolor TaxID=1415580 RepID=A0A6P7YT60_9AMPH|nr:proline and serine-rich protein 3 [Microcaecilia unicolor]